MKRILALFLSCAFAQVAFSQPAFDPFADSTGSGGSAYNAGDLLANQSNAQNVVWSPIDTSATGGTTTGVLITNANLTAPSGLPGSTGNAVLLRNIASGEGGRLNFGTNSPGTAATLYYSCLIQLQDITSLANATSPHNGGAFNMGFNNSYTNTQSGNPSVAGAPLYYGKSGSGFLLGTGRQTGGSARYWEYDPANPTSVHNVGDIIFVVVEYEIVPGSGNDVARLWVNPDSSTYGAATAPTPTVVADDVGLASPDSDLASVDSFIMMNRNATTPNTMVVDELRIGTNWAQVTSAYSAPVVIPTLSASILDPNTVQLAWGTNSTGFTLQAAAQLLSSGTSWSTVSGTPTVSGTNYIQTDTISGMKFYRLQH